MDAAMNLLDSHEDKAATVVESVSNLVEASRNSDNDDGNYVNETRRSVEGNPALAIENNPTILPEANDASARLFCSVTEAVERATAAQAKWAATSPNEKGQLLDQALKLLAKEIKAYPEAALQRRGYSPNTKGVASNNSTPNAIAMECENAIIPMISSLFLATWMHNMRSCLFTMDTTGKFPVPTKSFENYDGSFRHVVGPIDMLSWLVTGTASLELHTKRLLDDQQGHQRKLVFEDAKQDLSSPNSGALTSCEDTKKNDSHIVAVLGAGNYDAPVDILTAMLVESSVVIYKFSELADLLAGPLARIFQPFIELGVLSFVRGGPEVSAELLHHKQVTKWMLTGDRRTAYRILFGTFESPSPDNIQEAESRLLLKKPFVAELGNCTPYIICPGMWSTSELHFHARHLAFNLLLNGGHVCVHPQVILTCRSWPQRSQFLKAVRGYVAAANTCGMFYPHSVEKMNSLINELRDYGAFSDSLLESFSVRTPTSNLLIAEDLDPSRDGWPLYTKEAFCPISGEYPLDTEPTVASFLPEAVGFVNAKLEGTLACTVIAKCVTQCDQETVDHAIVDLQYGTVGLNTNANIAILFPQLVWGGFQRKSVHVGNLESGIGQFGNCWGFVSPIKSVVRAPFTVSTAIYTQFWPKSGSSARKLRKLLDRFVSSLCSATPSQALFSTLRNWAGIVGGAIGI